MPLSKTSDFDINKKDSDESSAKDIMVWADVEVAETLKTLRECRKPGSSWSASLLLLIFTYRKSRGAISSPFYLFVVPLYSFKYRARANFAVFALDVVRKK